MQKIKTETEVSSRLLRTGDEAYLFGQKVEFVCEYKNRLVFYSKEADCVADIAADAARMKFKAQKKLGDNCTGKLF